MKIEKKKKLVLFVKSCTTDILFNIFMDPRVSHAEAKCIIVVNVQAQPVR